MGANNHKRQERKLPVQQMLILALCRFGEPIAFTSIFPYLPEMIESLGVPPEQVAQWAGIAASMFPLAQTITAIPWGRASDRYGRKPIILLGLTSTMITSLLWGFSRSITLAIVARALAGAGNGNVGIIRTAVAEMVPYKELQPRAFSIMPLVWNIGSIFGPTLGGALANPMHTKPGIPLPTNAEFFERFPYALPNLVAAFIFLFGIITGLLFFNETLKEKQGQRDWGLVIGDHLKLTARKVVRRMKKLFPCDAKEGSEAERDPLFKPASDFAATDEETAVVPKPSGPVPPPPSLREVLHYQSILNLVAYTLLALHNIAFDQLIPIFMHYPVQDHSPSNPDFQPPFKFSGGFGLQSSSIGFLFTLYGVSGMIVQFFVFPPVARRFGVVRCLRVCTVLMPLIYFFVPFTALLEDTGSQQVAIFCFMIAKGFCTTFAFPSSTILLTNSASSLRILGTLNGLATSLGALGRAAGPAIGGSIFTLGVERGYVIAPWWVLSGIAAISTIPTFWILEGEGFGGDSDNVEDSDDEEECDDETQTDPELGRTYGSMDQAVDAEEQQEAIYGAVGPLLSRTNTASSVAASDDGNPDDEAVRRPRSRRASSSARQRLVRKPSRKMSTPIGMGSSPVDRRFSSNLGQSFGSAGSYHG